MRFILITTIFLLAEFSLANAFNHKILRGVSSTHKGIDYGAPCGTAVISKQSGVVAVAGTKNGFGETVAVQYGSCRAIYAHLSDIHVSVGQRVSSGKQIGEVGDTGASRGCHLHYESCSSLYAYSGAGSDGESGDEDEVKPKKAKSKKRGKPKRDDDENDRDVFDSSK